MLVWILIFSQIRRSHHRLHYGCFAIANILGCILNVHGCKVLGAVLVFVDVLEIKMLIRIKLPNNIPRNVIHIFIAWMNYLFKPVYRGLHLCLMVFKVTIND